MSNKCFLDWQFHTGRDGEGDKFAVYVLVHGSGRILAKVHAPAYEGGYHFSAAFHCAVPATVIDTNESFHFIDAESARAFVERILTQFDPLGKPRAKRAAKVAGQSRKVNP